MGPPWSSVLKHPHYNLLAITASYSELSADRMASPPVTQVLETYLGFPLHLVISVLTLNCSNLAAAAQVPILPLHAFSMPSRLFSHPMYTPHTHTHQSFLPILVHEGGVRTA